MKLSKHAVIEAVINCDTGLKIGGSKDSIEIGGNDSPIVRHPISDLPYIPGSSLKGKMRSLLELRHSDDTSKTGKPCTCSICIVCKLFGCGNPSNSKEMTRLIFRDAMMDKRSEALLREAQESKGVNFSEIKYENLIDRKTGKAAHRGLRNQERIPEGTMFNFELTLRIFEGDDEELFKKTIQEGFKLIQNDYLGGSGSRGYGKVTFLNLTYDKQPL